MQTRAQWRASVRALVDFYAYPRQALHTAKYAVISMLMRGRQSELMGSRTDAPQPSRQLVVQMQRSIQSPYVGLGQVAYLAFLRSRCAPRHGAEITLEHTGVGSFCQELPGWGSRASDCSLAADKSAVSGNWCWRSCALPVFSAQQPQQLLPARTKIKRLKSDSRVRSSTASVCWLRIDTVVVDSKSVRVWPTPLLD
jgi:hypothetical protein